MERIKKYGVRKNQEEPTNAKVKTHRGAAKRFSLTKSGKSSVARLTSAISSQEIHKRLRGLRQTGYIADVEEKKIRKLLPLRVRRKMNYGQN
jgi:large subunit ribosomal protein L35